MSDGNTENARAFSRPSDDESIVTNLTAVPHGSSSGLQAGDKVSVTSPATGRIDGTVVGDSDSTRTRVLAADDGVSSGATVASKEAKRGSEPRRPGGVRATRKARLRISRVDPWSVMKTSLLFSVAFSIMGFVAVWVLWAIIDASGALTELQNAITAIVGNPDGSGSFQITRYVDQWRVLGFAATVSAVNVVIMTALATLMSFLYNLAAAVLGGLEVTLAED